LDNRDFNLEALLGWIKWTLTALSKAEKAACKSFASFVPLTFLIADFSETSLFLLRAVLTLSFLTFLIALLMIGIIFTPVTSFAYDRHGVYSSIMLH